jgi:peptidoglycan/LPS O-acetylase OafA/YrhL
VIQKPYPLDPVRLKTASSNPTRLQELDALRGIAALMVVLFHLRPFDSPRFLHLGNMGVHLFFLISGFVILLTISHVSSGKQFVINRISRLYPCYWTAVTITFFIATSYHIYKGMDIAWVQYVMNLTMFQNYFGVPNLDPSYWTMFVEMQFYALVVFVYYTGHLKHIRIVGLTFCLLSLGLTAMPNVEMIKWLFNTFQILAFFPLFFAGMIFYTLYSGKTSQLFLDYVLVLFCFIAQLMLADYGGKTETVTTFNEFAAMLAAYFGVFILFVNGKIRFLAIRPLLFLGKISFSLYLIHQYILLGHLLPFLVNSLKLNYWVASILICLPVCIAIATAITYFVEIPYTKKLRDFLSRNALVKA